MVPKYMNGPYTMSLVSRLKEEFENIVIMDYHDKSKHVVEDFYCNAMANAQNTCKTIIQDLSMDKKTGQHGKRTGVQRHGVRR